MELAIMRRDDCVVMRRWEASLYRAIDRVFDVPAQLAFRLRVYWVKAKEAVMRRFEYYIDNEGNVKLRLKTGAKGSYIRIDGRLVKVSGEPVATLDNYSIIPWQEANNGYYDEELGAHVESKQHYRQLMKQNGLIPVEADRYGGSREYKREKILSEKREQSKKESEKAFISACRKYAPFGFDEAGL